MGKLTYKELAEGPMLDALPEDYVTRIEAHESIIFMERAAMPAMMPVTTAEIMNEIPTGCLVFSRTRNNPRLQREYGGSSLALLRMAQDSNYRVFEETLSPDPTDWNTLEFSSPDTHLRSRNRLITQLEYQRLTWKARRRFRLTKYFAAPKRNLELMWRQAASLGTTPLEFFSNIVNNGNLISTTSKNIYRAKSRNSFSTRALSGTANSKQYQYARTNAHIVYTPDFERLLSEHSEKWRNQETHTAAYDKGRKAHTFVTQAIKSAEQRIQNLGIKLTSQASTMDCDLFKSKPSRAASLLLEWSWSANFATLHNQVGNEDVPMEKGWADSVMESGGFLHSLRRGMTIENHNDLIEPTEDDWEEAQSFFDNHDDLCIAAGIGFNTSTAKRYKLPKTFSQYVGIIEAIESSESAVKRNADSIRSFLQMTLREMRDRVNQIGSGYVERDGVRVRDT